MKLYRVILASIAVSLVAGCAEDPSKNVPAAEVGAPAEKEAPKAEIKAEKAEAEKPATEKPAAEPAVEAKAPAGGNAATNLGGEIVFIGSKVTGSHTCRFKTWEGTVFNAGDLSKAQFAFEVTTTPSSPISNPGGLVRQIGRPFALCGLLRFLQTPHRDLSVHRNPGSQRRRETLPYCDG